MPCSGSDPHPAIAEEYLDTREAEGAGRHTVAKELGMLRTALRYARKHGRYHGDPTSVIPDGLDGAYQPGQRALSVHDYQLLRLALPAKRRAHLDAYVMLGMSDSVLYRLTTEHVDLEQDVVRLPGTKTVHRARTVPIRAELRPVLVALGADTEPGAPLFESWANVRRDLHEACARAQIAPVSPNDLRRTFATWLAEAGVPELVVAALMGHANSAMLRRVYARIGGDAQRAAIMRLPPLPTEGPTLPERQRRGKMRATTVTLIVTEPAPRDGRSGLHGRLMEARNREKEPETSHAENDGPRGVSRASDHADGSEMTLSRYERREAPPRAERGSATRGTLPRDRIELPTRGFSIRAGDRRNARKDRWLEKLKA